MKKLSFVIDEDNYNKLKDKAEKMSISMSALIRLLIKKGIKINDNERIKGRIEGI